ncbi:hypothetical protein WJX77_003678 [Trebouxia sp. C0004]
MQSNSAAVLVRGFVNLLVSQLSVRLINFALNLVTARLLTPEAYGLASVQFHLLNTGIVFLSREGLKRACQRIQKDEHVHPQKVLALGCLCIPLGACITAIVCSTTLWRMDVKAPDAQVHATAVAMQGFAAFVELCCGPLYILAKVQLADAVVAVAEGAATIAKGALTLLLLKKSSMPVPIALSWAQVAYGGVTMAVYLAYYIPGLCKWTLSMPSDSFCLSKQVVLGPHHPRGSESQESESELRRRRLQGSEHAAGHAAEVQHQQRAAAVDDFLLDSRSLALCWRFLLQAIVHLAQTEGSRMVMALYQSSYNQGVYGLVTNLGSLVVRTIFFPVEEAAFRAFSRPPGKDVEADKKQKIQILAILVRVSGLTGLLAAAFGPSYTYVLLRLVYGQKWSSTEAPAALACYCGYITLLALNGCTEAYINAVADTRQLSKSIRWQAAFSAAQIILSFVLVWRLGAIGLILADSANMVMRIGYSWRFIKSAVPSLRLTAWAPSFVSCCAATAAAIALRLSKARFVDKYLAQNAGQGAFSQDVVCHVSIGMAALVGMLITMLLAEQNLRLDTKQLMSHSRQKLD